MGRRTPLLLSIGLVCATVVLVAAFPSLASAAPGRRSVRVSGTALNPTNAGSYWGSISSDGRRVAFQSYASNLSSGGGSSADIFLRDVRSSMTMCVSIGLNGATPNGASVAPSISGNGQKVAFASGASNLVNGDKNDSWDVFYRSMEGTRVVLVSSSKSGEPGDGDSRSPSLSADGRWVAFVSASSNLTTGDSSGYDDVFVRDLSSGGIARVSVGLSGAEANGHSSSPSISADGRRVAFVSEASNLVAGDTNGVTDVFVVDVATLVTTRVSVRWTNTQANLGSYAPSLSGNGSKVAFESLATNLVSKDTNEVRDIFVRDLAARTTVRASVDSSGRQGTSESREPSLSWTGSKVAFGSTSSNLVSGDTNRKADIFLRNLSSRKTARVSIGSRGQAKSTSGGAVLSADGSRAVYQTTASNLVLSDANRQSDIILTAWGARAYDRVQGSSVYATAADASRLAAPFGSEAVVIVNRADWRAGIAASSLAGTVKAPMLYVTKNTLPTATRDEIVRLGVSKVFVVGGTGVVSSKVADRLGRIPGVSAVERVGSGSGYSVAASVASRVVSLKGSGFNGTVLVVSGVSYKASIAGVPLAAANGYPMVFASPYSGKYKLPTGTTRAIILGGRSSVLPSVESKLKKKIGRSRVVRISGSTRCWMANNISRKGVAGRQTWDGVTVVDIANPADAICGGVMAGRMGSVVLLSSGRSLSSVTRRRLSVSKYRIDSVHIMGPTSSMRSSVFRAMRRSLGG